MGNGVADVRRFEFLKKRVWEWVNEHDLIYFIRQPILT